MPLISKKLTTLLIAGLLVVGANLAVAYQAYRYFTAMRSAKAEGQQLSVAKQELARRLEEARQEQQQLQGEAQRLTVDRDNVLAQLGLVRDEKDDVAEQRDLFERVLKQTAQEHREMKRRFAPLQEERDELQRLYEDAAKERELLEAEVMKLRAARSPGVEPVAAPVADSKPRAEVRRAKDELLKEKQAHRKTGQELREAQERLKELQRRDATAQAKLAKLQAQYDELQDQYTGLMAQNKTLKHRAEGRPGSVAKLAQRHERLLKETADMHYNMGVLFSKNKQFYQAATEFRKVLDLRPDDAESYYNLGVIYAEHLPDQEKAVAYFRKYLQLNPRSRDASWVKKYIASWQAWGGREKLE